jgi:hypothetical protein
MSRNFPGIGVLIMTKNVLGTLILAAAVSRAADLTPLNLKPGLWETTTISERGSMPGMPAIPPEKLAAMPPEARARVEAQMKSLSAPTTSTRQSCRTDKDLRSFHDDNNKSCKQTIVTSTGTRQEMKMECNMSGNPGTGTVTVEAKDPEHVNGLVVMHMTSSGHNIDMKITINAKWLSSSCGDVKPDMKQQ